MAKPVSKWTHAVKNKHERNLKVLKSKVVRPMSVAGRPTLPSLQTLQRQKKKIQFNGKVPSLLARKFPMTAKAIKKVTFGKGTVFVKGQSRRAMSTKAAPIRRPSNPIQRESATSSRRSVSPSNPHSDKAGGSTSFHEFSLRPKDTKGLADCLLQSNRTFTRRFVRDYHKAWLKKYHPNMQRKEFLIDCVNQRLKDKTVLQKLTDHQSVSSLSSQKSVSQPRSIPYHRLSRVNRVPKVPAGNFKVTHIPDKCIYGFLGDGGCVGINLVESDMEDYRRIIARPKASTDKYRRTSVAVSSDSEASMIKREEKRLKGSKLSKVESMKKVNSIQFNRDLKAYLKQVSGAEPYNFPNLGMIILKSTAKEPTHPCKSTRPIPIPSKPKPKHGKHISTLKNTKEMINKITKRNIVHNNKHTLVKNQLQKIKLNKINAKPVSLVKKQDVGRRTSTRLANLAKVEPIRQIPSEKEHEIEKKSTRARSESRFIHIPRPPRGRPPSINKEKMAIYKAQLNTYSRALKRLEIDNKSTAAASVRVKPFREKTITNQVKRRSALTVADIDTGSERPFTTKTREPRKPSKGLEKLKESLSKQVYAEDLVNKKNIQAENNLGKRSLLLKEIQSEHQEQILPRKQLIVEQPVLSSKAKIESVRKRPLDETLHSKTKVGTEKRRDDSPPESVYRLEPTDEKPVATLPQPENLSKLFEKVDRSVIKSIDKARANISSQISLKNSLRKDLTERSQTLIQAIKNKSVGRSQVKEKGVIPNDQVETILNKPAALTRFDTLLKEMQTLPLPSKYQRLLWKFEQLENILTFLCMKDAAPFLGVVKRAFSNSLYEELTSEEIRQMLHVFPGCYTARWERQSLQDYEMEIQIGFPQELSKQKSGPVIACLPRVMVGYHNLYWLTGRNSLESACYP